jgi:hypothetical protein
MKPLMRILALSGLLALAAGSASAAVTVTYIQPDKFYDLPFSPRDREEMLAQLSDIFQDLGKSLPPSQDLRVEVTDFDPAGRIIPGARNGQDLRVVKGGADWPRMELRYVLTQNGQEIKRGEAKLADMNYQQRSPRYSDSEPLHYERRMIEEWFEKTFGPVSRR